LLGVSFNLGTSPLVDVIGWENISSVNALFLAPSIWHFHLFVCLFVLCRFQVWEEDDDQNLA
jgi:hypothetical protein